MGDEKNSMTAALEALNKLSDGEREEIFNQYCKECGSKDTSCQCWNDE